MIHPHTELRFVSPLIGHGVFATAPIPRGTIVYVKDALEIEIEPDRFATLDARLREVVERYSYRDERGVRVVSWDHAKYVNHRCDCNTMSTGWGFEIALRDIAAGEEITDDYGLFNLDEVVPVACGCRDCREVLRPDDVDRHHAVWDAAVVRALADLPLVEQPLWDLLEPEVACEVMAYLRGEAAYRSVSSLKHVPRRPVRPRHGGPADRRVA
jgi:hypothetical protein